MYLVSSNTSGSLGEREITVEGTTSRRRVFPQLFSSSPNFIDRNTENMKKMLYISLRKHRDEKKENNLLTLIIKM